LKYRSTRNKKHIVSFKEAVLQGIAPDGGLYMPVKIPKLPSDFFQQIEKIDFQELAFCAARLFIDEELPEKILWEIIQDAYNFDAPLIKISENLNILELFHGPTLAFKDFGARFMARTISYFNRNSDNQVTILVATSGDTGSAVANGFLNQPGVEVVLLYPSGMVSEIQEKQLTTLKGNVTALEVEGTFDDCQRLVKTAFLDKELKERKKFSSANSINIARLIPQSFYYLFAYAQLEIKDSPIIISVPSGNLGNLTAGLFAREMGMPVFKFIAALNINDVFLKYLKTGIFKSQAAIPTISNAMDVGNPSNFARILDLYLEDYQTVKKVIYGASFTDEQTREAIKEVFDRYQYIIDPHGAVGYLALKQYLAEKSMKHFQGIVLETAHPAKFSQSVEEVISQKVETPPVLAQCLRKEKRTIKISKDFKDFKDFLLSN